MGWSCQPWTTFAPNTWSRCSSISELETAFPRMLRMGMEVHRWLDCMVLWNCTPLWESLPCSLGWWQRMGRRNWRPSATARFVTTWCKITLRSTITFARTCVCPCSVPSTGVSILNTAAMTCGFTLVGSTTYPPHMWQYHHRESPRSQRSESPIEWRWCSASKLKFPESTWWVSSLDVLCPSSCSRHRVDQTH